MGAALNIDESFVNSEAPNAAAIKNGRGLVLKGKFTHLHHSADGTLLFGQCKGSGKQPYSCSCDFAQPAKPVHRCSCPSRQFPCKHCLGLMFAYVQGKPFSVADVPEELTAKREKAESRAQKKAEKSTQPKKVNNAALAKKVQAQLEGLDLLERLTHDLVRLGMGNTSEKTAAQIEQQAKQLGNAYLPGAQAALNAYTLLFRHADERADGTQAPASAREAIYAEALDQLTRLSAIVRQGRKYLQTRLSDPELSPETTSSIAAWLGHAWQLRELKAAGLVEQNAELMQLAFNSHNDAARKEYVDTGIWINLGTGKIQLTQTYRPYKATKYIKSEDSFFQVAQVPELSIYPGDENPRVRWDAMIPRPPSSADYAKIRAHAPTDFASVIKQVRGCLKAPLSDRHPISLLAFREIGRVEDLLVVEDTQGQRLVLTDEGIGLLRGWIVTSRLKA